MVRRSLQGRRKPAKQYMDRDLEQQDNHKCSAAVEGPDDTHTTDKIL